MRLYVDNSSGWHVRNTWFHVHTTLDRFLFIFPGRKVLQLPTSTSSEISTAIMQKQQTGTNQRPTNFPRFNPRMARPPSSIYGNPLTFKVAVMFLFYILSVTLCLSSVSTCICVVFNPLGTFRTIATYLFYALVLSLLLVFLSIALIIVYLDDQALPESRRIVQMGDEKLLAEEHHDISAPQEVVDNTQIQAGLPPVEAQAAVVHHLIDADVSTTNIAARDHGASSPTLVKSMPQPTVLPDGPQQRSVDTGKMADGIPCVYEDILASPEVSNAAELEQHALEIKVAKNVETAGQDEATSSAVTARESKKIEKWIKQTNLANTDDADDQDLKKEKVEMTAVKGGDDGTVSETRSASQDSDFQRALRVYMGRGVRCGGKQRRSASSPPLSGSREDSDFQRLIRETFMLESQMKKKAGST